MPHSHTLKLSLCESDYSRLLRHRLFRQTQVASREAIVSIHYDTRTLQLAQRSIELSLCRSGSSWIQTVRYAENSVDAESLMTEWTKAYHNHFDFSGVENAKLAAWLCQRKISSRITPIFESNLRRTTWQLCPRPGVVVQARIDRGTLVSSGRRESFIDVDLHLVDGCREDLFAVASQLAAHVALTPQLRDKAERGCRLFLNHKQMPVKAESFTLPADVAPLHAFQHIAFSCLRQLHENHAGSVKNSDPEYVHQMRVATRRLRAAIQIFKPLLPLPFIEQIIPPLRDLMRNLGRVRDLDVLTSEVVNPVAATLPDEPSIVALSAVITDRLYQARTDVAKILLAPGYGGMQLQAAEILSRAPFAAALIKPNEPVIAEDWVDEEQLELTKFAQARLKNLFDKLLTSAAEVRIEIPPTLHRMRICIKRLRYAMEFFRPMLPKKRGGKVLAALAGAQEKLGQLNDLSVAGDVLMACVAKDRHLHRAVSLVGAWHAQRYADLLAEVVTDIRKIQQLKLPRLE